MNHSAAFVTISVSMTQNFLADNKLNFSYQTEIFKQKCDRVECMQNCVDVKFNVKKLNQMAWFRGNSFRIDLDKPKLRMKREVIYSFTDVLSERTSAYSLWSIGHIPLPISFQLLLALLSLYFSVSVCSL